MQEKHLHYCTKYKYMPLPYHIRQGHRSVPLSACGHVVFFGGGPIAWQARKLNIIADSVALAEYSAASGASKELAFIRNILSELNVVLREYWYIPQTTYSRVIPRGPSFVRSFFGRKF